MSDAAAPRVRERAILTVFDHSGATPVAVEEVEVLAEDGRVVARSARRLGPLEAAAREADLRRAQGG